MHRTWLISELRRCMGNTHLVKREESTKSLELKLLASLLVCSSVLFKRTETFVFNYSIWIIRSSFTDHSLCFRLEHQFEWSWMNQGTRIVWFTNDSFRPVLWNETDSLESLTQKNTTSSKELWAEVEIFSNNDFWSEMKFQCNHHTVVWPQKTWNITCECVFHFHYMEMRDQIRL